MLRLITGLIVLSLTATSLAAQTWIGFGGASCGSWTEQRRTNSVLSAAYLTWVLGFLSGVNMETVISKGPDFLENVDKGAIAGWLDNYCRAQPLDDLNTATALLFETLYKKAK